MAGIDALKGKYQSLDTKILAKGEEAIDPGCLLAFPYEYPHQPSKVTIETDEFTALCPWTDLPDFGEVTITYTPASLCVELKSLKYYLVSYRDVEIVQEHAANRILSDLVALCQPRWMKVVLDYKVRGGLHTTVSVEYPGLPWIATADLPGYKQVTDSYRVRIEISFASGHRLLGHNGKCVYPHGHTYKAEIWVASDSLNGLGFVVDFTELKQKVGDWVEQHWDHAFLVSGKDREVLDALGAVEGSRVFVFPEDNPSAEVMARELSQRVRQLCDVSPLKVRVWESPTQFAEYRAA